MFKAENKISAQTKKLYDHNYKSLATDRRGRIERLTATIQDTEGYNFVSMLKTLRHQDPTKRLRHIRTDEPPINLNLLIQLGSVLKREVAILYDHQGKINQGRYKYTKICLFAASKMMTLKADRSDPDRGKNISLNGLPKLPDGSPRYSFIAHFHPTLSQDPTQLRIDKSHASEKVEMVVTHSKLIFYYNYDVTLNQLEHGFMVQALRQEYQQYLEQEQLPQLGTDITEKLFLSLPVIQQPISVLPVIQLAAGQDDEMHVLFAPDADNPFTALSSSNHDVKAAIPASAPLSEKPPQTEAELEYEAYSDTEDYDDEMLADALSSCTDEDEKADHSDAMTPKTMAAFREMHTPKITKKIDDADTDQPASSLTPQ